MDFICRRLFSYVKGLYSNPGNLYAWKFVYIESDPNKWDINVDNIMKESDPQVEAQLNQLMATQEQMENKSKEEQTANSAKTE